MKDLEMEENESAFKNLDNLTYDYNLKCKLWKSISNFHTTINSLEKEQIFNIDIENLSKKINDWINLCNDAIVDLEFDNIPKGLLNNIEPYKKILDVFLHSISVISYYRTFITGLKLKVSTFIVIILIDFS